MNAKEQTRKEQELKQKNQAVRPQHKVGNKKLL